MSKKPYVALQPSEQTIVLAAAQIYSAHIRNGFVQDGEESVWLKRSVRDAVRLARLTDECIQADNELD